MVSWLKWGILRWVLWQGFGTNALVLVSPDAENFQEKDYFSRCILNEEVKYQPPSLHVQGGSEGAFI